MEGETMNIQQQWIPVAHRHIRPRITMKPEYITIHETANTAKGADAQAHARLLARGNTRTASWHFTVDDKRIIQHIPENEVAWHAGDGRNGPGNRKSIGIEICVNADGDFVRAQENAIRLVRMLMNKYKIPVSRVVPHKHWSGKNCPANLLKQWPAFIARVRQGGSASPTAGSGLRRLLKVTRPMMRGDDIKKVQVRLGVPADGIYGPVTKRAVQAFQKARGLAVDGIVGPQTWGALFS
jgi:N-acetylmuramoyl-L-alanine amidase